MRRFVLAVTIGNKDRIINLFETKEAAIAAGDEYYQTMNANDGILCCYSADIGADNLPTTPEIRVYYVWPAHQDFFEK